LAVVAFPFPSHVDASKPKKKRPAEAGLISRRLTSLRRAKMATAPYTVLELRARRKKLGDFIFVKQIADLLNAMDTEIDKRQELLDAYRKALGGESIGVTFPEREASGRRWSPEHAVTRQEGRVAETL
jgi:hypothetical protein